MGAGAMEHHMSERSTSGIRSRHVRLAVGAGVVIGGALLMASPAFAAMGDAADTVIDATCSAFTAARKVLITAAVLAVIIGLAPMLWGQVKVKWVISSLVVCVFFSVLPTLVSAFAGGATGCSG